MIIKETRLNVADNTGILEVQCIGFRGNLTVGRPGDIITVAAKRVSPQARKYWKDRMQAMIIRCVALSAGRADRAGFSDNAVVILNNARKPIGTRVFGPVSRRVKNREILSMAGVVV